MPYILVVVDMQPYFFQHNNYAPVISSCQQEVEHAVKVNAGIIFLQYKGAGKTIRDLSKITNNYDKVWFHIKDIDDGSSYVKEILDREDICPKLIKVIVVQTDLCVFDTVEGLKEIYPKTKIHIIKNACGAVYDKSHHKAINIMSKFSNVSII